jgi:AcrR family transcriptional regulator
MDDDERDTTMAAGERTKRWQRRSEARPAEIVSAALDLFVEKGFAATTMEQIAARAGVTKGTVYLYFRSKEDLFRAVLEESVVPTVEAGEQIIEAHTGSAADLYRTLVRTWWSVIGRPPTSGIPKLIMSEASNFPALGEIFFEKVVQRGRKLFAATIQLGIDRGEFRRVEVDHAVRLSLAPLTSFVIHSHSLACYEKGAVDLDALVELHIDIFLRGIAKERAHGSDSV